MTGSDFSQLAAWMKQQAESVEYGEIALKIVVHDGAVKFVEKQILEKCKYETPADTGAGKN